MTSRHLELLVFVAGAAVMAAELTALRLLAPWFGASLTVTSVVVGCVLAFLSLGHLLGGRLGDRRPELSALGWVAVGASLLILALGFVGPTLARAVRSSLEVTPSVGQGWGLPTTLAVLLAVALLLGGPCTLLGMVSPWAVRLATPRLEETGRTAGRLYALSALGSIVGSFLPALCLIPWLGVRNTFLVVGVCLLAVSAVAAVGRAKGAALVAASLVLFAVPDRGVAGEAEALHQEESLYHHIRIERGRIGPCARATLLRLDDGAGIHSAKCEDPEVSIPGSWSWIAAASAFRDEPATTREICSIGLAGGTVAAKLLASHPEARVDGVELDGRIAALGAEYFDNADPRITPWVMDGRVFLQAVDARYDVIVVDAYRPPYVPFHLTTVEWWALVRDRLTEDGVAVINVAGVHGDSPRLLRRLYRTMREVFPSVHHAPVGTINDVLYALVKEKPPGWIRSPGAAGWSTELDRLKPDWRQGVRGEVEGWRDALVLTDDRAPVEMLLDAAAFRAEAGGG